ncbi:prepilin-type N-terminal cleavage/methylation domain-containing protein [Thioalkalivibrio sp. ALE23]|uniref:prepilin-type N-terminal cleavage/methylation domain-containing protein n=1 Tax=Thioalkalivibrio sp. ALE23 TaxID=1265495 RepID=UPI00035F23C4|nr:prepilin-type N-terminal cleavage/methylation domain-containing protein [Thioalkalivibrio sp. ALE23]
MQRAFSRIHGSGGFTLIELMVGLVLGLLLIGAVISVFVSNQETYRLKAELDDAQEAFRFGSHTLSRVIRQGTAIEEPENDEQLRVAMRHTEAEDWTGVKDCLGRSITDYDDFDADAGGLDEVVNIFSFRDNPDHGGQDLACEVEAPDGSDNAGPRTLVEGLSNDLGTGDDWFVRYGMSGETFWRQSLSDWEEDPDTWADVRSVAIQLAMQSRRSGEDIGRSSLFAATMRDAVFASANGGTGGNGGGTGGGNGANGNGDETGTATTTGTVTTTGTATTTGTVTTTGTAGLAAVAGKRVLNR